jgi:hypothetical protein
MNDLLHFLVESVHETKADRGMSAEVADEQAKVWKSLKLL